MSEFQGTDMGHASIDEWYASRLRIAEEQQRAAQPTTPGVSRPHEAHVPTKSRSERQRSNPFRWAAGTALGRTVSVLTIIGVGSGVAYSRDLGGVQEFASSHISAISQPGGNGAESGIMINPIVTTGQGVLDADQCQEPAAASLVVTVTGEMPLVPKLTDKDHKTAIDSMQYMTTDAANTLTGEAKTSFSNFITESGYPEATVYKLPMAVSACEVVYGSGAVVEGKDGGLTIDRSKITPMMSDPSQLLKADLSATYQSDSPNVTPDAKNHTYLTVPDPLHNMFTSEKSGDKTYNASRAALLKANDTQAQRRAILALMETSFVEQLSSDVTQPKNVTYPNGGINSLQDAIDQALNQQIKHDTSVKTVFKNKYNVAASTPKDPNTKKSYADSLVGLDKEQVATITSATVQFGSMALKSTATTAPTPTATTGK